MTNNLSSQNDITTAMAGDELYPIADQVFSRIGDMGSAAKEKYDRKSKLIENADDMTTREKLDAMDENYDSYRKDLSQYIEIAIDVTVIFLFIGFGARSIHQYRTLRRAA